MKVLWLCNSRFSERGLSETGTWLQPLAEMVNNTEENTIVNVTFGSVADVHEEYANGIMQYVIPSKDRLKLQVTGERIERIISKENPDLVHIWGTENVWGRIYLEGYIKAPAFMEMQGMKSNYYYYYGGLTFKELLKCNVAPMSIYAPSSSLYIARRKFKKDGNQEIKVLKAFNQVSVQSRWVEDHVLAINPQAHIYHTKIILRELFYHCDTWQWKEVNDSPVIFSISSSSTPYKGIHVLIRAIGLLKKNYPNVRLNVAGAFLGRRGGFFSSGYSRYLLSLIRELSLEENVCFLGPLSAEQIIEQLQTANVCVIPSFIETYCVALAEAMMVGTPCVVSYAGAMPEFAEAGKEALFYNSADYISCAYRVSDCLKDRILSEQLSSNGKFRKMQDCNKEQMLNIQLSNYKKILADSKRVIDLL